MITALPDVTEDSITNDCDFIFLGCDGVWDCMTNQEVADFIYTRVKRNPSIKLSKILEEMLDKCLAADLYSESGVGCDNMTAVLVQLKKK